MRKLTSSRDPASHEQDPPGLVRQLAGQLQIANVVLQDLDFETVLEQTIQTICALHHSEMGLLLLSNRGAEPTSSTRKDITIIDSKTLQETVQDSLPSCSHAIILWRGWVHELLRGYRGPSLSSIVDEMGEKHHFASAPLTAGTHRLGRMFIALQAGQALTDLEMQNFSNLVDEVGRSLDRARMLDQAKQRHREAEALYQTVHEISTYLELGEVLGAIVRRARDLLATDTAYLTLKESDRDEIYMRVTEGIESPEFKSMVMKLGEGLGGLVAKLREPVFTPNYLDDPRIQHVDLVSDAVSKEGIVGILGVPLIVADRVIGVLFAANRRQTYFSQDNVKLLASLGNSAAVAIEKAWLYTKEKETVAKLQELNELITAQHEMLRKSMHIYDQLARLLLSGHGTEQIAMTVADLISNPVIIEDHQFRLIAQANTSLSASQDGENAAFVPLPREALQDPDVISKIRLLAETRQPVRLPPLSESGLDAPRVMAPIIIGQEVLGYLSVSESNKPLEELDYMILGHATTIIALGMAKQKAALEVELRLRGDFLDEILSGRYESEQAVLERGPHFGYDLTKPHQVMAVAIDNIGRFVEEQAVSREELVSLQRLLFSTVKDALSKWVHGVVITNRNDAVIILLPIGNGHASESIISLANWLLDQIGDNPRGFTVSIGLGRVCNKLAEYALSCREAMECLTILNRLGKTRQVLAFDQLGVMRLLFGIEDKNELRVFAIQTLGQLQEYDMRHGGSLVQTIQVYLENNGNLQATAKTLYIHVNTLLYRLRRIHDICHVDLEDAETRLNFQIALKILKLIE